MPLQKFQKRQVRRIPRCDGPAFGGTHFWKTAFPRTHPGFMSRLTAKPETTLFFNHFRIILRSTAKLTPLTRQNLCQFWQGLHSLRQNTDLRTFQKEFTGDGKRGFRTETGVFHQNGNRDGRFPFRCETGEPGVVAALRGLCRPRLAADG